MRARTVAIRDVKMQSHPSLSQHRLLQKFRLLFLLRLSHSLFAGMKSACRAIHVHQSNENRSKSILINRLYKLAYFSYSGELAGGSS